MGKGKKWKKEIEDKLAALQEQINDIQNPDIFKNLAAMQAPVTAVTEDSYVAKGMKENADALYKLQGKVREMHIRRVAAANGFELRLDKVQRELDDLRGACTALPGSIEQQTKTNKSKIEILQDHFNRNLALTFLNTAKKSCICCTGGIVKKSTADQVIGNGDRELTIPLPKEKTDWAGNAFKTKKLSVSIDASIVPSAEALADALAEAIAENIDVNYKEEQQVLKKESKAIRDFSALAGTCVTCGSLGAKCKTCLRRRDNPGKEDNYTPRTTERATVDHVK